MREEELRAIITRYDQQLMEELHADGFEGDLKALYNIIQLAHMGYTETAASVAHLDGWL